MRMICERSGRTMAAPTNSGEVRKRIEGLNPLSRARKERAPGIPRDMMRGKSAQSADSSP